MGRLNDGDERWLAMSIDQQLFYVWMLPQIFLGMWLGLSVQYYVLIFAPLFFILFWIDVWRRHQCGWRWNWRSLGTTDAIVAIVVVIAGLALVLVSFFAPSEFRRLPAMTVFVVSIALFRFLAVLKIVHYTREEFEAACQFKLEDEPEVEDHHHPWQDDDAGRKP